MIQRLMAVHKISIAINYLRRLYFQSLKQKADPIMISDK
jgi:hypothetical protein